MTISEWNKVKIYQVQEMHKKVQQFQGLFLFLSVFSRFTLTERMMINVRYFIPS